MTFNPKVSIVIPVYNGSDYLREAIESALTQTYNNIEIIVVNDGSNDSGKTEQIALSYGNKIRYFSKENGWVASALNLGIREMKGEYFSWLSHDDMYCPEKIEVQVNYLSSIENKSSIIYSDWSCIDENSRFLYENKVNHILPEHFRPAFIMGGFINGCTLLIPKVCFEICGSFNETLRTTQDYDLWFRFSEKYAFIHMPLILVKLRLHPNQVTNKLRPIMKAEESRLYLHFITKIKPAEIKIYYQKPVPVFYLDYSNVMLNYHLYKVADFSLILGLINFWRLKFKYSYEYFGKVKSIIKANYRRLLEFKKRPGLNQNLKIKFLKP